MIAPLPQSSVDNIFNFKTALHGQIIASFMITIGLGIALYGQYRNKDARQRLVDSESEPDPRLTVQDLRIGDTYIRTGLTLFLSGTALSFYSLYITPHEIRTSLPLPPAKHTFTPPGQ